MTNNIFIVLLSGIMVHLLYVHLFINTSRDIIDGLIAEVGNDTFLNKHSSMFSLSLIGSIMLSMVFNISGGGLEALFFTLIFCTHFYISVAAFMTDPVVHRINRHLLRAANIINFVSLAGLILMTKQDPWSYIVPIGLCYIVLVIGFFTITGIGASDYRCMLLSMPTMLFFYGTFAIVPIFLEMMWVIVYQVKEQRKYGKQSSIPIGHQLMLSSSVFIVLGALLTLLEKS